MAGGGEEVKVPAGPRASFEGACVWEADLAMLELIYA